MLNILKKYCCISKITLIILLISVKLASAREVIKILPDDIALDVSQAIEIYQTPEDHISIPTAPAEDGTIRRVEVQATTQHKPGKSYNWAVFYVKNPTTKPISRLIVTPHYRLIDSKIKNPDLGSVRISSITPSDGATLIRSPSHDSDVFSVTLKPETVTTFVAELTAPKLPPLYFWQLDAYKDTQNSFTLYQGILLGIAVLISLYLSVLFLIRGTFIFPAAAIFSWASVAYIGLDFHFIDKIITIGPKLEPIWRSSIEVALCSSLIIFLCAYLNLYKWHYKIRYAIALVFIFFVSLASLSITHPLLTATIARIAIGATTLIGSLLIMYLSFKKHSRAVMIVPTWLLLILWVVTVFACITGHIDNDIIEPALSGGLILLVILIGFTILQDVFSSSSFHQGIFSDVETRSLAILGAEAIVWHWDVKRDKIETKPSLEHYLGTNAKLITGPIQNFINGLHLDDRNLFAAHIQVIMENPSSQFSQTFRLASSDGQYHWFILKARPVIDKDGEITNCIGTMTNINEYKASQEQILKDSINDHLTGLPNKALFLDRLQYLSKLSDTNRTIKPVVIVIDFDGFRNINKKYNYSIGNKFLLLMSRRFSRVLKQQDTITHLKADRFAIILMSANTPDTIVNTLNELKRVGSSPVKIDEHTIHLKLSIGIYNSYNTNYSATEILSNAELSLAKAKQKGGNEIVLFEPKLRTLNSSIQSLSEDLPNAIKRNELSIKYLPILSFDNSKIVGFEAYTVWNHPQYGHISITDFVSCAENGASARLISKYTFNEIAKDLVTIKETFPEETFFISMNLMCSDMLHQDFIDEVKSTHLRFPFDSDRFVLEVSENVLAEKPEQAALLINTIRSIGFKLCLDHFSPENASFAYLSEYHFDLIKFNKIPIYENNSEKLLLIKTAINLAHSLAKSIIATAVDTEEEAEFLSKIGCDYIQSRIFTDPLELHDLIKWITKK